MRINKPLFIFLIIFVVALVLLFKNMYKEEDGSYDGQTLIKSEFSDGFEGVGRFEDLFPQDGSRWHNIQNQPAENSLNLTADIVHSGEYALIASAAPYKNGNSSKADVVREGLGYKKGDDIYFSGWYFLRGSQSHTNLFLWDLEAPNAGQTSPGRRIYLTGQNWIASDLGKSLDKEVFRQKRRGEISFPNNEWVNLKIHLYLSEGDDGIMKVWQNDVQVISGKGKTLPSLDAIYERLQVGITANGNEEFPQTVYVDDIEISKEKFW